MMKILKNIKVIILPLMVFILVLNISGGALYFRHHLEHTHTQDELAIDNKCSDKNCNHQAHIKVEYHGCDCGFFVTINHFFLLPEKVDIALQPKEIISRNTICKISFSERIITLQQSRAPPVAI